MRAGRGRQHCRNPLEPIATAYRNKTCGGDQRLQRASDSGLGALGPDCYHSAPFPDSLRHFPSGLALRMTNTRVAILLGLGLLVLLPAGAGCADGTLPEVVALNPLEHRQWAIDRQYGPTMYEQLAELDALESGASRLTPQEQQYWTNLLTNIVQHDENGLLRARSVRVLGGLPNPQALAALHAASADKDEAVRIAACEAWRRRGGDAALDALAQAISSDRSIDVRLAAARALASFRDPRAIQALGVALNDRDPALQRRAIESLRTVSGRDYRNDLAAWRQFVQGGNPAPPPAPSLAEQLRDWF